LNKPLLELERELSLRPNNNDLSVMSIIQGRRQTFSQTKPGLVVVGLEEVPPPEGWAEGGREGGGEEGGPPAEGWGEEGLEEGMEEGGRAGKITQLPTLSLLADRFSGLSGSSSSSSSSSHSSSSLTPSSSRHSSLRQQRQYQGRGGISTHTEILCIFTSNYPLLPPALALLRSLPLFEHLVCVTVEGLGEGGREGGGEGEKQMFVRCYLQQLLALKCDLPVDAVEVEGWTGGSEGVREGGEDIRGLVRQMRAVAFLTAASWRREGRGGGREEGGEEKAKLRVMVKEEGRGGGREGGRGVHVWVNGKLLVRLRRARERGKHKQQQEQQQQEQRLLQQAEEQAEKQAEGQYNHANLFPLSSAHQLEDERIRKVLVAVKERRRRRRTTTMTTMTKGKQGNGHANGGKEDGRKVVEEEEDEDEEEEEALGHTLQYYFQGILAPAVVVIQHRHGPPSVPRFSSSSSLASTIMTALTSTSTGQQSLPPSSLGPIDVQHYRVVKSLYDGPEVPNVRDDIKKALLLPRALPSSLPLSLENGDGKGGVKAGAGAGAAIATATTPSSLPSSLSRVAIHLQAFTLSAQLKIRELVEDTPSMVAFSTARSALQKEGLLFVVEVGEVLSPELRSRASLVLMEQEGGEEEEGI